MTSTPDGQHQHRIELSRLESNRSYEAHTWHISNDVTSAGMRLGGDAFVGAAGNNKRARESP